MECLLNLSNITKCPYNILLAYMFSFEALASTAQNSQEGWFFKKTTHCQYSLSTLYNDLW